MPRGPLCWSPAAEGTSRCPRESAGHGIDPSEWNDRPAGHGRTDRPPQPQCPAAEGTSRRPPSACAWGRPVYTSLWGQTICRSRWGLPSQSLRVSDRKGSVGRSLPWPVLSWTPGELPRESTVWFRRRNQTVDPLRGHQAVMAVSRWSLCQLSRWPACQRHSLPCWAGEPSLEEKRGYCNGEYARDCCLDRALRACPARKAVTASEPGHWAARVGRWVTVTGDSGWHRPTQAWSPPILVPRDSGCHWPTATVRFFQISCIYDAPIPSRRAQRTF